MPKLPSPCVDVCKHKIKGGYCIACGMTKSQRSKVKKMGGKERERFVKALLDQQAAVGSAPTWQMMYARKCKKAGVKPPFGAKEHA